MEKHELRGTRLALGLTLRELASMLRVSQSYLWKMEKGQRPIAPGLDAAVALLRELHLDRLHARDREKAHMARITELEARAEAAEARAAALDAWRESIEWLYLPDDAMFGVLRHDGAPEVAPRVM